jgi:hypothetical protein
MTNEETSWYIDLALCVSPQRTYDVLLPTIGEGFPFDEFENQERRAVRFSNVIDRRNIRMVERCQNLRLPLDADGALSGGKPKG